MANWLTGTDLQAIWLTVRLAATTTLILFLVGTPLAWWLAKSRAWWKQNATKISSSAFWALAWEI